MSTSMTRKHFIMLAQHMKNERGTFRNPVAHQQFCERMADTLRGYNPNFDRRRFLDACGATLDANPVTR